MLTEVSLTFDQCDQQHCPEQGSSDESGDLTSCLKQVVAFNLKCLFPDGGCNLLATFDDGVCSEVWGDSEKSQPQDDGESDKDSGSVLCATVVTFLAWGFAFLSGTVADNCTTE